MTDTHGQHPDDHQPEHEQELAPAEHEAWQGHTPPDDDFNDPGHGGEQAAAVSEGPETMHDASSMNSAKKRSVVMPIAVAVGGLLFLGAILYWQFGGMAHPPVPPAQMAAGQSGMPKPAGAPDTTAPNIVSGAVSPTSGLPAVPETAPVPFSGTATPGSSPASAPLTPAAPPPPETMASVATQPAPSNPNGGILPAPIANPAPSPSPTALPMAASNPAAEARLTALSSQVDNLQKALNQTTQQLNEVNAKLANVQPAATNPAVNERLNKIEQQVMQIQQHATSAAAAPDTVMPAVAGLVETPATKVVSPHQASKYRHKTAQRKKTSHVASQHEKASSHWVLRAATPEEAWVASSNTAQDLRPVKVGDSLKGIGRVTAIRQDGDNWVIKGTQGSIQ